MLFHLFSVASPLLPRSTSSLPSPSFAIEHRFHSCVRFSRFSFAKASLVASTFLLVSLLVSFERQSWMRRGKLEGENRDEITRTSNEQASTRFLKLAACFIERDWTSERLDKRLISSRNSGHFLSAKSMYEDDKRTTDLATCLVERKGFAKRKDPRGDCCPVRS